MGATQWHKENHAAFSPLITFVSNRIVEEETANDMIGSFMYMGHNDEVYYYKHTDTRCYIHLKPSGEACNYESESTFINLFNLSSYLEEEPNEEEDDTNPAEGTLYLFFDGFEISIPLANLFLNKEEYLEWENEDDEEALKRGLQFLVDKNVPFDTFPGWDEVRYEVMY